MFDAERMDAKDSEIEDLLAQHRARLDTSMRRGLSIALWLGVLAGFAQAAATWWGSGATTMPVARLALLAAVGLGLSVLCLGALGLLKRRGVAASAQLFAHGTLLVLLVLPWLTGDGLSDASLPALGVVVLSLGLLVSPQAALRALWFAVAGLLLITVAQLAGWIPGPQDLRRAPLPVVALGHLVPLLLGGWLVVHYGRLFWSSTRTLEDSRRLLSRALDEQEQAAERLRGAEERQRTLLDAALTGILIFDGKTGALLFANPQVLSRYGIERQEALDVHWLMPGDGYGPSEAREVFKRTLAQGPQYQWWCSRRSDGSLIWWDIKTQRIQINQSDAVVVFGHDISDQVAARAALAHAREQLEQEVRTRTRELQNQQQRMAAILDALPLTLSIRDSAGLHQLVNREFERSTGWRREQVLGQHSRLFMSPEEANQQDRRDAVVLAGGGVHHHEQQMVHPQAGPCTLLYTAVAMPDGEGGQLVLCLGTDVSALKRLQHELERARDEAERLAVSKSDFLANMSHEIRTPLNAVLGLAQLALQDPDLNAGNRLAFERIHDAGNHLLGVVNDVLDFAKLEADKFTPDLRDSDPAELARAALELVEPRARIKALPLRLELDPALPARLPLDPLRVRQVLVNLLGNAVKFTVQGEVRLQVAASPQELVFTVHDTGPGIDAAQRERIFQAFEQADSTTTRHFGGTGLGLSISRRLARGMGGDITLYSQPGLGSQFSLRLPLAPTVRAVAPAPPPIKAPRFGPEALKGLRVLIVDDVAINREILGEMLVQLGAQFEQVGSGPEALEWVATRGVGGIDLVLMDIQMPGMDGYEATRRLHQAHPDLPVLALTANALPEQRAQSAAAGMRGHITKPVELAELVAALREQAAALGLWLAPEGGAAAAPSASAAPRVQPVLAAASAAVSALADWDHDAALTRCAGKVELLRRLLRGFVDQYCCEPLPETEPARSAWTHRLKGTSANLGLMRLSRQAAALEAELRGEAPLAGADQALQALLMQSLTELDVWLAQAG